MTLQELVTLDVPVLTIAQSLSNDSNIPEDARTAFGQFVSDEYAGTVDLLLSNKYGQRELIYSEDAIEDDQHVPAIKAYLYSKWRYIAQCMSYLATEYNPIENYQGDETETTTFDGGARSGTTGTVSGSRTDTREEPEDQISYTYGEHTDTSRPAAKTTTTTTDKQTTTTETAPFESSEYFHKDKVTLEGQQTGGASQTTSIVSQTADDSYTYAQRHDGETRHVGGHYLVTDIKGAQTDSGTHSEAAYQDVTTRVFSRHGNLGMTTSAQMLTMDADFWKAFGWLDDLAHDLAVILAVTVWAV